MQSKEFISLAKNSFRQLRKGEAKFVKDLADDSGISWPTTKTIVKKLKDTGYLKDTIEDKLIINPDFKDECFAGVYISKKSINFSVIDFSGKEIYYNTQNFDETQSFYSILKEKISSLKGIKAISICSDNLFIDPNGDAMVSDMIFLDSSFIKEFLPKETMLYFGKTFISNSLKYYEDYAFRDYEVNVIISFYEDNYYYTIWSNGKIVQKRKYPGKINNVDELYPYLIIPMWKVINPNNIIFIVSSKDEFDFWREKSFEWTSKIFHLNNTVEQIFEGNKSTRLIAIEQTNLSETAAFHAMYNYYGWNN